MSAIAIHINEAACVGCGQCALVCEAGAILTQWGRTQVDADRCILCGVCIEYCPVDALVEDGP